MEAHYNFTMLPDIARSTEDIDVFSRQDECDYLISNGMHNRKERKKINKQIEDLKISLTQEAVSPSTGESA